MALSKETVTNKIEVLESGQIQVQEATWILEDGKRIMEPAYHRFVLEPGQDLSTQNSKIVSVANAVWTDKVIEDFKKSVGK